MELKSHNRVKTAYDIIFPAKLEHPVVRFHIHMQSSIQNEGKTSKNHFQHSNSKYKLEARICLCLSKQPVQNAVDDRTSITS